MKKVLLGIVVGALLVVGTWSALDAVRAADQTAPPAATGANAALAAAPVAAAHDPGADAPAPPVRTTPLAAAPTWRLVGAVVDAEGRAIVDASVRVSSRCEGSEPDDVATVRTGADGRYVADLAPLRAQPPIDLERTSLAILVRAPGGLASASAKLPHVDVARDLVATADATLQRGAIATGRVVDASGRGVHGAEVALRDVARATVAMDVGDRERVTTKSPRRADATTDGDGGYVLFTPDAVDGVVDARHPDAGRAEAPCQMTCDRDTLVPDLVLRSAGTVRGRVVFEDGEPAVGVAVRLRPPDGAEGPIWGVTTGADGWFVSRTIGRAASRLCIDTLAAVDLPEPVVTTDGEPATIVLTGMHQIRLRFADAAGRSLRPLRVAFDRWGTEHTTALAAFAAGGELAPELEDAAASGFGAFRMVLVGRGTWVSVRATHGDAQAEAIVHAVPPRNVHEVLLTLRERAHTATVRVDAMGDDGSPVHSVELRLEQLRLGEPGSHALAIERAGDALLARWAPGRYRLEIRPSQKNGDLGWFLPLARPVELRDGDTTDVRATLPLHGRVRFHFHTPDAAHRGEIAALTVATPAVASASRRATFVRFHADGWTALGDTPANEPLMWMPLLPPGRHVLTIRSRDFVDVDVGVDIAPRVATDAHVWLQPK